MKKIRFILYAFILGVVVVSCKNQEEVTTIVSNYNERINLSNDYSESILVFSAIDSSSSKALKDSVNNWIFKFLSDSPLFYEEALESWNGIRKFTGNKDDLKAMARYYTESKLIKNPTQDMIDWLQGRKYFCFDSITIYPNKGLTSVMFFEHTWTGGAHPNAFIRNATFDNETGHIYDLMEIINDTIELKKMIIQGIKKYFAVGTDEELKEMLLMATVDNFPLPQQLPYFMEDKLVIQYQPYEIAPYGAGVPQAIIPLKDCEKILREDILKKLQIK